MKHKQGDGKLAKYGKTELGIARGFLFSSYCTGAGWVTWFQTIDKKDQEIWVRSSLRSAAFVPESV